jgi:hypothetical protein
VEPPGPDQPPVEPPKPGTPPVEPPGPDDPPVMRRAMQTGHRENARIHQQCRA